MTLRSSSLRFGAARRSLFFEPEAARRARVEVWSLRRASEVREAALEERETAFGLATDGPGTERAGWLDPGTGAPDGVEGRDCLLLPAREVPEA